MLSDNTSFKYMVCIHCLTYNHEKYLADALEGFVMQKTDFPFVAVVIDDCSTDGTADVLRKYEEKYPEIIKAVYLKENYYSQHKSKKPFLEPWDSKAKYIALCEGDDFWTDPMKLQKQVDLLESHPDYSMCFHSAKILIEIVDIKKIGARCEIINEREYTSSEMFSSWIVPTASILYRKALFDSFAMTHRDWLTREDIAIVLTCAHVGRVWGMSKQMSVYRMQPNSVSHNPLIRNKEIYKLANHFRCLYYNFPEVDKESIKWCISSAYYGRMKAVGRNLFQRMSDFCLFFFWNPQYAISKMKGIIRRKLKNAKTPLHCNPGL